MHTAARDSLISVRPHAQPAGSKCATTQMKVTAKQMRRKTHTIEKQGKSCALWKFRRIEVLFYLPA